MSIANGTVPDARLRSLGIFLDVVFALIFFRIVEFLPSFQDGHWVKLPHGLLGLLASSPANLTRVILGLMMTVYYWYRKNIFLSLLARSNGILATLSTASLFFVCLFMYALVADPTYAGGAPTLLLQSVSILIGSFLSFFALHYAIRADLVRPELRPSAEQIARVDLSNPLAALVATGLSWSGLSVICPFSGLFPSCRQSELSLDVSNRNAECSHFYRQLVTRSARMWGKSRPDFSSQHGTTHELGRQT